MPTFPIPFFVALVLFVVALRLWQARRGFGPLSGLLILCAVQSLIIALAQHYEIAEIRILQPVTATLIPPAAWLSYQITAVRRPHRIDLLHVLGPLISIAVLVTAPRFLDILIPWVFVVYGVLILNHVMQGADAQPKVLLSKVAISWRIWFVIGISLIVSASSDILITISQIAGYEAFRPWIISVFSAVNLLVIGLVSLSPHVQTDNPDDLGDPLPLPEPDPLVWERVSVYMAQHKPYLDADLTLGRLSRKLGIPAKPLSSTINRMTGGNVSRFINEARIRTAQQAILDGDSITDAMLSSGFNTKSNFNREFRRIVGESPSAWLRKEQHRMLD